MEMYSKDPLVSYFSLADLMMDRLNCLFVVGLNAHGDAENKLTTIGL